MRFIIRRLSRMKIKVTYDANTRAVVSYSCVPVAKIKNNPVQENQAYIAGSMVPQRFYTDYLKYSLTDDNKLLWHGKFYEDNKK